MNNYNNKTEQNVLPTESTKYDKAISEALRNTPLNNSDDDSPDIEPYPPYYINHSSNEQIDENIANDISPDLLNSIRDAVAQEFDFDKYPLKDEYEDKSELEI